jgi:hypothetical protein
MYSLSKMMNVQCKHGQVYGKVLRYTKTMIVFGQTPKSSSKVFFLTLFIMVRASIVVLGI